ncbi:MAG: hypothetical protein QME12_01360 [Nanoarchaeota archaeon]|nr:hypothetical protein [Nanoarchaeota archaeon]
MPSLEERLFHCLENNLNHKDGTIQLYSKMFEGLRDAFLKKDFSSELADVLNKYHGKDVLAGKDLGEYEPMHIENNYAPFQQRHGILSFLFGIVLPEKKWKRVLKKLKWQKWASGLFVSAGNFSNCGNTELRCQTFGLALGSGHGIYGHEALHANRQFYANNFFLIDGYGSEINYSPEELKARCEYRFIDEMHAFISDNWEIRGMKNTLKTQYWPSEIKTIYSLVKGIWPISSARKNKLKNAVKPVFAELDSTIDACFYLKQRLDPFVLTPLFYAIAPTADEIRQKEFPSIFADIRLWAGLLEKDVIRPNMIRTELQKKGYCLDSVLISVP